MPQLATRVFLGRIRRAPHRGDSYYYATIEPLLESDSGGERWLGPVQNAVTRFQKRGFIHWHDAPLTVKVGDLWQFTVDEHPSAERRERTEYFQLDNANEPIEVVDLRGWADENLLRSGLTEDGIALSPGPIANRQLLWLASGLCIGPVRLKFGPSSGLWLLDSPEAHRDAARMPVRRIGESGIDHVMLDGSRWLVSPRLDLGQSAGIQNWMSNAQVARSILTRLRKMDPEAAKGLGVTEHVFREYLERIERGRFGSADSAVERARGDRLRGVIDAVRRDSSLLSDAADALLATEEVRALVERRVEESVAAEVQARQSAIDAELTTSATALKGIGDELRSVELLLATKRAESEELEWALLEKRRELEETVASFESEVVARLEEIARRPQEAFADSVIMRALAGGSIAHQSDDSFGFAPESELSQPVAQDSADAAPAIAQIEKDGGVRATLVAHAGHRGLSLHAMLALHAMFAAGTMPVLVGARAYDLLRAYASAVAGERLHWVPVGSSMLEPEDVLGRFDGRARRLIPAASGLLDALSDAKRSGRLHIVVLDGFNRAPAEGYLLPILEAMRSGRSGDSNRAIPLAPPAALAENEPYRELARLTWPTSVLIACIPTEGTATLPVSPAIWSFASILDADDRDRTFLSIAPAEAPPATDVSPALWNRTIIPSAVRPANETDRVLSITQTLSVAAHDAANAARVRDSLTSYGLSPADAETIAVITTLIPRSGADSKTIEAAMAAIGITSTGWRTVWNEAARLRT